ncbi:MAG: MBL fold metallo-hydrolase [Phycisphaerae bacterium]|nr:MBL fold metallo-hydrolase [Phycisphaerae bacterium]
MFMRMVYDEKLAQAAYVVGCQKTGEAIVIDPERDVDRYIDLAASNGLRIVAVAETHIHADFVSGARELAERVNAKVYVSGEGGDDWQSEWLNSKLDGGAHDHRVLRDGDTFDVGNISFKAVHTPGHTPEHITYLVTDRGAGADQPIGALTGDFVFVGDLGRPDLLETAAGVAGAMEPSARALYRTIDRFRELPEFVQVWPAHGAGSACGKALGAVPASTVGYERRFSPAIRAATSEAAFVEFILADQPEPPLYFKNMKRVNKVGPKVLNGLPTPRRLSSTEITSLDTRSVALVDTRPWGAFRVGHVRGALSFPRIKSFCTDVGSMVSEAEDIVLIVEENELPQTVRELVRIGLDNIVGWIPAGELAGATATIAEVDVASAQTLIAAGDLNLLDVRRRTEYDDGHIENATNISHTRLAAHVDDVPTGSRLLINCRSGVRSARASAFLARRGFDVINLKGGYLAWAEAHASR